MPTTGLPVGQSISANLVTSGGIASGQSSNLVMGIVQDVLATGSGFTSAPPNISSCNPAVVNPGSTVVAANPDTSATAVSSLKVSLTEAFIGAFAAAATADGGLPGVQGMRFRMQLTGVPRGIAVYAPEAVSSAAAATTGSVTGGGATTALSLVSGANADGSGGTPLASSVGSNRFDLIQANSAGTATIVYEVTTAASVSGFETVNIFIALTGTPPTDVGTIGGSVSLAPVGPPTAAAARPQFSAASGTTLVANVFDCSGGTPPALPATTSVLTSPSKVSFIAPFGANPTDQKFDVLITGPTPISWSAAITSITGGNWLTLTPASGTGNTTVTASVNSKALSLGSYSATVTITAPDSPNSPVTVPVTLDVSATLLSVVPTSLTFNATAGGGNPASQALAISANAGVLGWTATPNTSSGGNWLSVSPTSGQTPSTATVSVNAAALAAGTYNGTVTISGAGAGNAPQVVTVTLTVIGQLPFIFSGGIVNAASYSKDAVLSPGSIASIFGTNLAGSTLTATTLPLGTTLAGVQVLVNNIPSPLFYVSPTQINFQVPLITGATAQVAVVSNQVTSASTSVTLGPQSPGIFSRDASGTGPGAILNQDFSLNSAQNPATVGSVIAVYVTGLGATDPPAVAGQPGGTPPSPLNVTIAKPVVLIGGVAGELLFSGLAPGFVGAYQVNVRIPAGTPTGGTVGLSLSMGGLNSNTVTVAIR